MSPIGDRIRRAWRRDGGSSLDLAGLDGIPWRELTHAYGPAEDVPENLRALTSSKSEDREEALNQLYGTIWHQGTVYEATAPTVPFLVTIATAKRLSDREGVIRLLADIANGSGYVQVHRWLIREPEAGDEELDAAEASERQWVAAARGAVLAATPKLVSLLADTDVEVRRATAYTLAQLPEDAPAILEALDSRLREEPDPATRAGLIIALAVVCRAADDRAPIESAMALARQDSSVVRLAAGIAQLIIEPDEAAETALVTIMDTVEDGAADLVAMPWAKGEGAVRLIGSAIGDRPRSRLRLVEALARSPNEDLRWNAVAEAGDLTRAWRSITPGCVSVLAAALEDQSANVRVSASGNLACAFPAVAPAADALARRLDDPDERVARNAIVTLARLRDLRALPVVARSMESRDPPEWVGQALTGFGEVAGQLLPNALEMVRRLPAPGLVPTDNRFPQTLGWIGSLGAAAQPAVPRLVEYLVTGRGALPASAALANLGAVASVAERELRRAGESQDLYVRAHAAGAVWRIAQDAEPLLQLAAEVLDRPRGPYRLVLEYLEDLGTAAGSIAPLLQQQLSHVDEWHRVPAARAYWRVTAETDRVLGVLLDASTPTPVGLVAVEALGWLGSAAHDVVERLNGWLLEDRRLRTFGGVNDAVEFDEKLRIAAAKTLALVSSELDPDSSADSQRER
jgi:hypothetical protein